MITIHYGKSYYPTSRKGRPSDFWLNKQINRYTYLIIYWYVIQYIYASKKKILHTSIYILFPIYIYIYTHMYYVYIYIYLYTYTWSNYICTHDVQQTKSSTPKTSGAGAGANAVSRGAAASAASVPRPSRRPGSPGYDSGGWVPSQIVFGSIGYREL